MIKGGKRSHPSNGLQWQGSDPNSKLLPSKIAHMPETNCQKPKTEIPKGPGTVFDLKIRLTFFFSLFLS